MNYPVMHNNKPVGEVFVNRVGLYYRFDCQCTPPDENIYRIVMCCNSAEFNLGICVPSGENFVLTKQLAARKIKDSEWAFYLRPQNAEPSQIITVSEQMPFPMLDKLEFSRLLIKDEELFISVRN